LAACDDDGFPHRRQFRAADFYRGKIEFTQRLHEPKAGFRIDGDGVAGRDAAG
jgi:hypothetical protein